MLLRKRTTGPGVSGPTGRPERPVKEKAPPEWRITPARLSRVALELAREHRRIAHLPTMAQMRTMAGFDGRAPSTYDLELAVNWLPEALRVGLPDGADGLCFTRAGGEVVVLPNGCGFELD
jgi:hypothetical protein